MRIMYKTNVLVCQTVDILSSLLSINIVCFKKSEKKNKRSSDSTCIVGMEDLHTCICNIYMGCNIYIYSYINFSS